MKNPVFIILLLLFLFGTIFSCKQQLTLIGEGNTSYQIVVDKDANIFTQKAATALQQYLEKITNVKIPVSQKENSQKKSIFIGKPNSELENAQILIKNEGDNLVITGKGERSTLYAVYEFLEKFLDCRFYVPGAEKVPNRNNIKIPIPLVYSYTPDITTRTVHSKLFYDNHDFADKQRVTYVPFPNYVKKARVHTFQHFLPEKIFLKKHPEYYALRKGKRIPTQLCLTNENVLKIVCDSVKVFFEQSPDKQVISVSQDDNQQYCQCDNCKQSDKEEGSPAGTMIRFVNRVAKKFPDKTISTLAYQYTRSPGKTKPAKNVLITLCSIECDRSAPIEQKCLDFAKDLKAWKNLTTHIRIWDYTTQFTNFLAPFPNIYTLHENIRFFRDNNAKWVFEQHSHEFSELFELRSYITAKLLWNPDLNFDVLLDDFINGYYEEAGTFIKSYITKIHDELKKDPDFFLFLYGDPSEAFGTYLNPYLLESYSNLFDKAEEAVKSNPIVMARVKKARISTDFAILEACKKNLSSDLSLITKNNGQKTISEIVKKKMQNFKTICGNEKITFINEMGFKVKEYISLYEKTLQRAVLPNYAYNKKVNLLTKPKKYADEDPQTLTDGAFGGSSFYANWIGFEGNDLVAIIDLEKKKEIKYISTAFLQVVNHIVFFPKDVRYYYSIDNKNFKKLGVVKNLKPLMKESKINEIEYFNIQFHPVKARYIKVEASNMKIAPDWHHGAGMPAWIFADEILVN